MLKPAPVASVLPYKTNSFVEAIHHMRYRSLVWSLFLFLAFGRQSQAQDLPGGPPPEDKTAAAPAPESQVAPDAAVITIAGLCDTSFLPEPKPAPMADTPKSDTANTSANKESVSTLNSKADAACKTVVTRAQFENLVNALNPHMEPEARAHFAGRYPEMLVYGQAIREMGVERNPIFEERIRFNYLQVLGKIMLQYLQDKANNVTDAEVEKYYQEHPEKFQRADLMRIFILNHKVYPDSSPFGSVGTNPTPRVTRPKEQLDADEAAMRAEAEKIRREALAGGNFAKLQARAYKLAQDPDDAPEVKLGKMTPDQIPAQYEKAVFSLSVGQLSDLIADPNGWHIFKVLSKETVPLSEAKPIVQRLLMRESMESIKRSIKAQLNDQYFVTPDKEQTKPIGMR